MTFWRATTMYLVEVIDLDLKQTALTYFCSQPQIVEFLLLLDRVGYQNSPMLDSNRPICRQWASVAYRPFPFPGRQNLPRGGEKMQQPTLPRPSSAPSLV